MAQKNIRRAVDQNKAGIAYFESWEIDNAIEAFDHAVTADPGNPEYRLNLARAYARAGVYDKAMHSLGEYLRLETEEDVASRYEWLFSSALDKVETILIETMRQMGMPIQQVGKAIQMWLEYRITIGRRPLRVPKPELWAAAITYAVCKVNLIGARRAEIARTYQVKERSLKEKYDELVTTLDLMPADYRYFTGEENPLDKLVEAAQLLEELDHRFQQE
ncbi:MAG: tetratricopeptide repeat protein [Anaerolineae bacterium]